jgi:hypothetical protein
MMAANEKTQPVINSRVSDRLGMVGGDPFSHIFRSLRQLVELGPQEWDITAAQKKNFKLLVANNPILRERSFRLGAEVYQKMGFVGENSELLYSNFDARPDTFVLLVENEERKDVATLTIVCDSDEDGLPLDDIYLDEADRIRARGRRTAAVAKCWCICLISPSFMRVTWLSVMISSSPSIRIMRRIMASCWVSSKLARNELVRKSKMRRLFCCTCRWNIRPNGFDDPEANWRAMAMIARCIHFSIRRKPSRSLRLFCGIAICP